MWKSNGSPVPLTAVIWNKYTSVAFDIWLKRLKVNTTRGKPSSLHLSVTKQWMIPEALLNGQLHNFFFPQMTPIFVFSSAELISPAYDILNVFLIFPVDSSRPPYSLRLPVSWAEYFIFSTYFHSSGNSNDNQFFSGVLIGIVFAGRPYWFLSSFPQRQHGEEVYVHRGVWCRRPPVLPPPLGQSWTPKMLAPHIICAALQKVGQQKKVLTAVFRK